MYGTGPGNDQHARVTLFQDGRYGFPGFGDGLGHALAGAEVFPQPLRRRQRGKGYDIQIVDGTHHNGVSLLAGLRARSLTALPGTPQHHPERQLTP